MHFPFQHSLEQLLSGISLNELKKFSFDISSSYRSSGKKKSFNRKEAIAYLLTRMPATFAVLQKIFSELPPVSSMIDLGCGTGSGLWAAMDRFPEIEKIICLERDQEILSLARELASSNRFPVEFGKKDLSKAGELPGVDLALFSYSYGELDLPVQKKLLRDLWESTIPLTVIVEPGTPRGFERIWDIREKWISWGGHLLAPCPGTMSCPMRPPQPNSRWCHFSVRLPRTSFHRQMKQGSLGFEDEKFSYLILSKTPSEKKIWRLLTHPKRQHNSLGLQACTLEGERHVSIAKTDREVFKALRRAKWGDAIPEVDC